MENVDFRRDLDEALAKLESHLETPVVPGELATWFDNVCVAFAAVKEPLQQHIQLEHPPVYKQIKRDADNLYTRVEQLQQEDLALLDEYERLNRCSEQICKLAPQAEPNEARFDEHRRTAVTEGLAFVLRVRMQERAVETWLQESLMRDNGESGGG